MCDAVNLIVEQLITFVWVSSNDSVEASSCEKPGGFACFGHNAAPSYCVTLMEREYYASLSQQSPGIGYEGDVCLAHVEYERDRQYQFDFEIVDCLQVFSSLESQTVHSRVPFVYI